METVLKVIGAIWTLIGLRNLLAMFWTDSSQGVLDFGFMFNLLLFVLPGLVVYGIGARMKKSSRLLPRSPQTTHLLHRVRPVLVNNWATWIAGKTRTFLARQHMKTGVPKYPKRSEYLLTLGLMKV